MLDDDVFNAEFGIDPGPPPAQSAPWSRSMQPVDAPLVADSPPPAPLDGGDLEEIVEPLPAAVDADIAPLEAGARVDLPDARAVRVLELLQKQPGLNIYSAALEALPAEDSDAPEPTPVLRLRQGGGEWALRLGREASLRQSVEMPMAPRLLSHFESGGHAYALDEMPPHAETLAALLESGAPASEWLHVLTQVASALARLHGAGWVHGGLRPQVVALGKPVQITDFSFALPAGEVPSSVQAPAGYAAPECIHRAPADPGADIYAVGAMLFHALDGAPLPESGADLRAWTPPQVLAGAPQILHRCLGAPETRYASAEELRRDLVKLKGSLQPALHAEVAAATTIGLEATRSTNQDAFSHASGAWQNDSGSVSWAMACVADGMGGMAAGEVASEAAAQSLFESATQNALEMRRSGPPTASDQAQIIKDWARAANERVCHAMDERQARGGCTLVAALAINGRLAIAHTGDCRMYLWRAGSYQLLTRDHSFVMALVLQGEVAMDEVRSHPDRSKVTRSMGDRHPLPDYFVDGLDVATGAPTLELQGGDILLLCSDGLWEPVDEEVMAQALGEPDLHRAARRLTESALRQGAPDNATVALLRVHEASEGAVEVAGGPAST